MEQSTAGRGEHFSQAYAVGSLVHTEHVQEDSRSTSDTAELVRQAADALD